MQFPNKLVAIVNKEIEIGVAMNAVAHMTLGLGAALGRENCHLDDYQDKDGNIYPNISGMPFIILRGKSSEIRKAIRAAREHEIKHGVFLHTMTGGTYKEQLANTALTTEEELKFYSCVLLGPWDKVSEITKRFSLYN